MDYKCQGRCCRELDVPTHSVQKLHLTRIFDLDGRARWLILADDNQAVMFKNKVCEQRAFSFGAACLIAQCAFGSQLKEAR